MVERLVPRARRLHENAQIILRLRLADEIVKTLRPERRVGVFRLSFAVDQTVVVKGGLIHG